MATTTRTLNSGTVVMVDTVTGIATFRTCFWLIRVPSGHPEPDSFADTFRDVECGARLANDQDLCTAHQAVADAPFDDWHDLDVSPATDLSHVR
jgi:hypothetical protein